MMEVGLFSFEDIENLYIDICPDCEEPIESGYCEYCKTEVKDPELGNNEIYEYWIVSKWLASKLRENNEPIIDSPYSFNYIWGRTTTGQSIECDYVIEKIVKDLYKEVRNG